MLLPGADVLPGVGDEDGTAGGKGLMPGVGKGLAPAAEGGLALAAGEGLVPGARERCAGLAPAAETGLETAVGDWLSPAAGDRLVPGEGLVLAAAEPGPSRGAAGTPGQRPHVVWQ